MKVLVACELPEVTLQQMRSLAFDVAYEPEATAQKLREEIADVGVLVVGETRVSPETISQARALQMIVHAGRGPGNIAVEAGSAQGVFVTHCPDKHATAVAELTLGLILALDRRLVDNAVAVREGRWMRGAFTDARGLAGRTIGILGYGAVGRLVAQRARAFDMRIVAWLPRTTLEPRSEPGLEFCNWPRELARLSDIVTVHDIEDGTDPIVDAEFLRNMREGAYLVHVGDRHAVDEAALAEAIEQRKLRVALDVFTSMPSGDTGRFRSKLCDRAGVIGTQQIGPLTAQARDAIATEVVRIVHAFVVSGEVLSCLNICERSPATWQLVLRVRDQVGVMAAVLEAVRADGINAEEISSRVFTGAKAAWCTIALNERPSTEALESIRGLADVLHLELRAVV